MIMCHGVSTSCDWRDSYLREVTKDENASPFGYSSDIESRDIAVIMCKDTMFAA